MNAPRQSKQVKDYERALGRDPHSLANRLKLAAALRDVGRRAEAGDLVRSVALEYRAAGRLVQALAVCRSLLELDPDDFATRTLQTELDAMRTGAPGEDPTHHSEGIGRIALPLRADAAPPFERADEAEERDDIDDTAPVRPWLS